MHKAKNFILKTITKIDAMVFLYFACWLDVESWIPFYVCCATGAYLALFAYANDFFNRDFRDFLD